MTDLDYAAVPHFAVRLGNKNKDQLTMFMFTNSNRRYLTAGLVITMTAVAIVGSWLQDGQAQAGGNRLLPSPLAAMQSTAPK